MRELVNGGPADAAADAGIGLTLLPALYERAGFAAPASSPQILLGWSAAVLAVITAYVRALGAATGTGQHYIGPMAKQQRMAVLTIACVVAAVSCHFGRGQEPLALALAIITAGSLWTAVRRTLRIVAKLEQSA